MKELWIRIDNLYNHFFLQKFGFLNEYDYLCNV